MTYLVRRGAIQRRSQGLYAFAEPEDLADTIAEVLALVPQGYVDFATALQLHGLTDELPDDLDLLVPGPKRPKAQAHRCPAASGARRYETHSNHCHQ